MIVVCECEIGRICPTCLSDWTEYNSRLDKVDEEAMMLEDEANMSRFYASLEAEESDAVMLDTEYSPAAEDRAADVADARHDGWGY